jgi:hypothetical protein
MLEQAFQEWLQECFDEWNGDGRRSLRCKPMRLADYFGREIRRRTSMKRFFYALYLTVYCLGWIWGRFFNLIPRWDVITSLRFERCWHCDERFTRPGLVYCQRCIEELRQEYECEAETQAHLGGASGDDAAHEEEEEEI